MENEKCGNVINISDLCFHYHHKRRILNHINLVVNKGETIGIIGPSGEGKTTLLRLINGSLFKEENLAVKGSIKVLNTEVENFKNLNRYVGSVYQNPDNQIVFTNVVDEIVFAMENYNYSKEEMDLRLNKVITLLNIKHLIERNPNHLSGGEKQLVVLASVLCLDVQVLLLDEAFAYVDADREKEIFDLLYRLKKEGIAIVMVEHDMSHLHLADCVYRLNEGILSKVVD